jgi:hypothetical protein
MTKSNFYTVKLPKKQTHAFLKKAAKKKLDALQSVRSGNYQLPVKAHTSSNAKAALAVTFIYSVVALAGVGVLVARELKRSNKDDVWNVDKEDVSKKASELKKKATSVVEDLTGKAQKTADDAADAAKDKADDARDGIKDAADEVKRKAN